MTDKSNYRAADDRYEAENDDATDVTGDINDSSYVRPGETTVPVQKDSDPVEDPVRPPESNSDAQLGTLVPLLPILLSV